jgi:hypothetical protein
MGHSLNGTFQTSYWGCIGDIFWGRAVFLPAHICDTSLWLGHCTVSRMRAFTRATVVPQGNTNCVLDVASRSDSGRAYDVRATRVLPSHWSVCGRYASGSSTQWRVWKLLFINHTVIGRCIGQATDITVKHAANNAGNRPQNRLLQTCAHVCIRDNSAHVWHKVSPAFNNGV